MIRLILHEQHMHIFQFLNRFSPVEFAEARWRYDEAVQDNIVACEASLDVFDDPMELDLLVAWAFVLQSMWFDEGQVLLAIFDEPQEEVRIEVAGLEEPDASAAAFVTEQE